MLIKRVSYFRQRLRIALVVTVVAIVNIIVLAACSSTALTKSQRDAMERYVDLIADAIHLSATQLQKPLYDYHVKHGTWPVEGRAKQEIVAATGGFLEQHGVEKIKLLTIDDQEVLVEFFFSKQRSLQFPALIESWLIVFSSKNQKHLEIVSVFPNWYDPAELAKQTPYDAGLIRRLQEKFRRQLSDKLKHYNVILNETINQSV